MMKNEREKLVEELNSKYSPKANEDCCVDWSLVADFIIADRRRIVTPLLTVGIDMDDIENAIAETLKLAGV